ncbi:MAG TPA: cache domain-containing protein [Acetobacteraceae bacterium]|nr:cache domain-containing protein [Acetobacteraceae bacterium]
MRLLTLLIMPVWLLLAPAAFAEGQATPDDAKALAIKAAEYLKAVGPEKALPEFSAKDGPWHDRELYVVVQDSRGVIVAHGTNPGLIGRMVLGLKDVDGKPFNQEVQAVKDVGWVTYKWQNPITKAVENKTQYTIRVGEYVVGVGAYAK